MKRILFVLFALFATVNLAHGQTLNYTSSDSVLFSKSDDFETDDSSFIAVDVYIIKGFKADKDDNGFDCDDPYVLRGKKGIWRISTRDDIYLFDSKTSCSNDEQQWSFNVDFTSERKKFVFGTQGDKDYTVTILIHPVENHDTFQAKRVELWGDEEPIRTGCIAVPGSSCRGTSTSSENPQELPNAISLDQNYPNPFNPQTTITYQIDSPQNVRLDVFNAQGQRIQTLVDGVQTGGDHSVDFNADSLPSGVYVYRLQAGGEMLTRKMTLVR